MQEIKLLIYSCHSFHFGLSKTFSKGNNFRIEKRTSFDSDIISDIQKVNPDIILICCHFLVGKGMDFISEITQKISGAKIMIYPSRIGIRKKNKNKSRFYFNYFA